MDFGLSDEQVLLQDSLSRLLAKHAPLARTRAFADSGEARADDVWQALIGLGLPGLLIAERHGGSGLGPIECALVAECLGRHVAPVPFVATSVLMPLALRLAGSPAQGEAWLPRLAQGAVIAGAALSELTGAREDAGVTCTDGRLHGRALFVLDFEADVYLVAGRDARLFLVAADAPGVSRRRFITIDRSRHVGELIFDRVQAEWLPGSADAGIAHMLIDHGRVMRSEERRVGKECRL